MRMSEGIQTCKDKVGYLLNEYVALRDSDKLLWLAYLCKFHDLKSKLGEDGYKKLKEVIMDDETPTMESIRRVRQKYQENGMYAGNGRRTRMEEETVVRGMING